MQNRVWSLTPDPDFYVLTTTQPVGGGNKLLVGLTGVLSLGATKGILSISMILLPTGMSEARLDNNSDAERIEYFQK